MRDSILSSVGLFRSMLVTVALAIVYLALAGTVQNSYVLFVMALIPIWSIAGVSWNIFSGYSGLLSFGHGAFFGLGAFTAALLFTKLGISPWLGVPLAGVTGALAGLVVGLPTFRLRGVYFSLAMLAYPLSLLHIFDWLGFQEVALPMMRDNSLAYMQFDDARGYIAVGVAVLVLAVLVNLRIGRSRFGLSLLAIKQNELAAQAAGINPFRWKLLALVVSGAIAGIAGALYAVLMIVITPSSVFGILASAQVLIFTMFGGVGRIAGPIVGAAILIPLSELLSSFAGSKLPGIEGVIYGVAIVAVVLLAPDGLIPRVMRYFEKELSRRPATPEASPPPATTQRVRAVQSGPVVLQVQGLSKRYGGLDAVSNVSFDVHQGEILGIIGPNGAGKTTLFNLLNRIVTPTAGSVLFDGRDLAGLKPHEVCKLGIGRTFQVARPFTKLSVLDNVVVGALVAAPDDSQARQIAADALERVGMAASAEQLAGNLTAVELRLMEVARALASRPRLLLLDEVLAGLGGSEVERVVGVLMDLSASGLTIVIIEHTMHAMVRLADRLLVLEYGTVLTAGEPTSVTSNPAVIEAYLGKKWVKHAEN